MTTIAANREMIAADSQAWDGIKSECIKIQVAHNGDLVGIAGALRDLYRFMHWYKERDEEIDTSDSTFLVLTKQGKLFTYESGIAIPIREPFYAIGSGAQAAMGIMYDGGNPIKAVKIACKVDNQSGGKVRWKKL